MIVYWDLVLLFNFLTDYLLLYGTVRLSGFGIRRGRLALTAFAGALCSAYVPWATGGFKETPHQMAELMCCFYTGVPREEE